MIPFQWGTSSAELLRMVCQGWFKSLLLCVVQPVSQPAVSAVAAAQHIRFRFKQHRSQTFLHGLYNLVLPASLQVLRCQEAASGDTTKLLIQLQDGLQVEAVVMHYDTTGAANTTSAITSYCCICSPPPCSTSCAWSSGETPKGVYKSATTCDPQEVVSKPGHYCTAISMPARGGFPVVHNAVACGSCCQHMALAE